MGGLKRALPVTYWTFLIGSLAIAGVPGLAGFFSKDEILFETFSEGHTLLWVVGALTSLLTATYMFRLVFLTFHGSPRYAAGDAGAHGHHAAHDQDAPAAAHGAAHSHGSGHGHHLHDAPPAMAIALIVLAIGSVAAGYIGVPHALGGHNSLAAWLAPAFEARPAGGTVAHDASMPAAEPGAAHAAAAEGAGEAHDETALELTLMGVSSGIALAGIALAAFFYLLRPNLPGAVAARFAGVHRLLLNKYFVDEIYDAGVVRPIRHASQEVLWRRIDVRVIDGAVNGTGVLVTAAASGLRRLQTGSVRVYAGSLFAGVLLILGYYFWR
jgi:NADH-quinone oxidoreductase subunit L